MATGTKRNNLAIIDGTSFQDTYNTIPDLLTAAFAANLSVLRLKDENGEKAICWYYGTSAIAATLLAMAQFPKGTIVFDLQAHTTVEKTGVSGTSAWATSAART
jgi:hypothetical protein